MPVFVGTAACSLFQRLGGGRSDSPNYSLHVAVEVRIRANDGCIPKGELGEAGRKRPTDGHFRPVDQERDHAKLFAEGTFDFETNEVGWIIKSPCSRVGCIEPVFPDEHNYHVTA